MPPSDQQLLHETLAQARSILCEARAAQVDAVEAQVEAREAQARALLAQAQAERSWARAEHTVRTYGRLHSMHRRMTHPTGPCRTRRTSR